MSTLNRTQYPLAVLVVDDSADAAETLAELLSIQGHTVSVAFSGEQALERADAAPPDVVLLDIRMPGLDGCAVARAIRERCLGKGKRPFLVAVTGCGTDADRARTAAAGFDLHMVKPVDPGVLTGLLERFRRVLAPPVPQEEAPPEDPPDDPSKVSPSSDFLCEWSDGSIAVSPDALYDRRHR